MGLRDNRVWLVGPLVILRLRVERIGGLEIPIAVARIRTGFPGGRWLEHHVILVGRQAAEAAAFVGEGGEVEAAVDGWLFPDSHRVWVVADGITFVVPNDVRRRLREHVQELPRLRVDPHLMAVLLSGIRLEGEG